MGIDALAWQDIGRAVAEHTEQEAWLWWEANRPIIEDLAESEIDALIEGCCRAPQGEEAHQARMAVVATMPQDEAVRAMLAWQRDTYDQLSGIAHRRARLLKALGELSGALLRQVFEVVRRELGVP